MAVRTRPETVTAWENCALCCALHGAAVMGLADGPTEVHKTTVAKQVLRDYSPVDDMWPSEWIPKKQEAARKKYADYIELEVGNL